MFQLILVAIMDTLYKKTALPGFDDKNKKDHTIDDITDELTKLFQSAQRKIKDLTRMGISDQSEKMSKNIQTSLASRLQEMSTMFRKSQSKYLKSNEKFNNRAKETRNTRSCRQFPRGR